MKVYLCDKVGFKGIKKSTFSKIGNGVLQQKGQPTAGLAISLFLVDEEEIRAINGTYRGKDNATDVITFRLIDTASGKTLSKENFPLDYDSANGGLYLGEIFICTNVAKNQAVEIGHSMDREIAELFVHGMLHILGHDHEEPAEAQEMKKYEEAMYPLLDKLID